MFLSVGSALGCCGTFHCTRTHRISCHSTDTRCFQYFYFSVRGSSSAKACTHFPQSSMKWITLESQRTLTGKVLEFLGRTCLCQLNYVQNTQAKPWLLWLNPNASLRFIFKSISKSSSCARHAPLTGASLRGCCPAMPPAREQGRPQSPQHGGEGLPCGRTFLLAYPHWSWTLQ